MKWDISIPGRVAKRIKKLPLIAQEAVTTLLEDIKFTGPIVPHWPNFGKITGKLDCYHCHIRRGRPTYVAVWQVVDRGENKIEVKYVGTHEGADYGKVC